MVIKKSTDSKPNSQLNNDMKTSSTMNAATAKQGRGRPKGTGAPGNPGGKTVKRHTQIETYSVYIYRVLK